MTGYASCFHLDSLFRKDCFNVALKFIGDFLAVTSDHLTELFGCETIRDLQVETRRRDRSDYAHTERGSLKFVTRLGLTSEEHSLKW